MSIAFIALKACNSFWTDPISDILAFGRQDPLLCYYALNIIKHTALEFSSNVYDNRTTKVMENFLRENLQKVLGFLNEIISSP
jgi:hypothetical protein